MALSDEEAQFVEDIGGILEDPWRLREMRDLYRVAARRLPELAEAFEATRRGAG